MPKIGGGRRGHKTRHKTVTHSAALVYEALLAQDFFPHPGLLSPKGGRGGLRITVTYEPTRVRIAVNSVGSQELLIYGAVDRDRLYAALQSCEPLSLTIRDQCGSNISSSSPH